jgi:hypothetical protein
MFIDLGGGGFTESLSDFQFALPAKMQMVAGVDGQLTFAGATLNPTVAVTDLHGDPVVGATVYFGATSAATTSDGTASVPWPIAYGPNALSVTGRGIASPGNDGPRDGFDPFQPIHYAFDNGALDGPEVAVGVGSVTFNATGQPFADGFEPVAESWLNTGYWHRSTLTGPSNSAVTQNLVSLAPGDGSAGALPAPFGGARALWFGSEPDGNYAGSLANTTELGGTSADARGGTATSPVFLVPAVSDPVRLTFRSWFEIESVNPSRFDLMIVSVQDVDAGTTTELLRLNPGIDYGGPANVPFTSGGYNLPPVWTLEGSDVSRFKGHRVRLLFTFATNDRLYNAFRGWVVDDVTLQLASGSTALRVPLTRTLDIVPSTTVPVRTYHP